MKIKGIEFRTDIEGLEKTQPPQPANFFMPKWFKTMPSVLEQQPEPKPPNYFGKVGDTAKQFYSFTVKKCPAIVDFLTQGYVIPFWCDMLIQRDHMMLEWDNKGFPTKLEFHDGIPKSSRVAITSGSIPDRLKICFMYPNESCSASPKALY